MLAKLKSIVFESIKNKKLNVFSVFLLISFLFLGVSKLSKRYTQSLSFKVAYINVPENVVIVSNDKSSIDITLSAFGFNLLPYYLYENTLNIDFESDVVLLNNEYNWIAKKEQHKLETTFGSSVEIASIEPDTLKFSFETLEVRKVPIQLDSEISFASGYDIQEDFKVIPDSVNIVGSINSISRISSVYTNTVKLDEVNSDINSWTKLHLPDSINDLRITVDKVNVIATVEKFTEGTVEIPITIINLPDDITINYFPKSVTVAYYVSLSNYNKVIESDFEVVCDYNVSSSSKQSYFIPELSKLPEVVKSARIKQSKIEFILIE